MPVKTTVPLDTVSAVERTFTRKTPNRTTPVNQSRSVDPVQVIESERPIQSPAGEAVEVRESGEVEGGKRRMPDHLRRFLIKMQGGKMYLPAAYRIVWFRDELGDDWGIRTSLVEGGHQAGFATVHAEILNPAGRVIASGHKTEAKNDFPAGWVEKAESGAVARALALMGFGTQFTPELDDDGYRPADSPQMRRSGSYQRSTIIPSDAVERKVMHQAAEALMKPHASADNVSASVSGESSTVGGVAAPEIWAGPGQCPQCHAPEGKRHGRQCLN
jgi:hypothetical protein